MANVEQDLRTAAANGDHQSVKRIIYRFRIYPRLVLLRIYKGQHRYYREKIAEFIGISGIDINAANEYGVTALHSASSQGGPKCVEILLKFGANINATEEFGQTALHDASGEGKPKCVEILFQHFLVQNARPGLYHWRILYNNTYVYIVYIHT